jgi:hypothetical protein
MRALPKANGAIRLGQAFAGQEISRPKGNAQQIMSNPSHTASSPDFSSIIVVSCGVGRGTRRRLDVDQLALNHHRTAAAPRMNRRDVFRQKANEHQSDVGKMSVTMIMCVPHGATPWMYIPSAKAAAAYRRAIAMLNPRKLLNHIGALVNKSMPFIFWSISRSALFFEMPQ